MKRLFACLALLLMPASASEPEPAPAPQPRTFNHAWAGQTHTMQEYFIVFLKTGPAQRSEDRAALAALQQAHLDYLGDLYKKGIINLNGPTGDGSDIRGFSVYNVATKEEAERLASGDPMVQAGYLAVEVHPWWLAKGAQVK
jgi:uncharacterized protein YciI